MSSLVETPEYQAFVRFIDLTIEKQQLSARLDELRDALKAMQPALLGYLTAADLQSLTVKNYLVFPHREPWVYPMTGISRQMVCEALKVAGLGKMVNENYSTQTLTTYIKQLETHAQLIAGEGPGELTKLLHPALGSILNVKPAFSLRIKKKETSLYTDLYQESTEEPTGEEQP